MQPPSPWPAAARYSSLAGRQLQVGLLVLRLAPCAARSVHPGGVRAKGLLAGRKRFPQRSERFGCAGTWCAGGGQGAVAQGIRSGSSGSAGQSVLARDVEAAVQAVSVDLVKQVVHVELDGGLVVDGVLDDRIHHTETAGVHGARALGVSFAAVSNTSAGADLGRDGVGAPDAAAVLGREAGAVALHLRAAAVGGQGHVAAVDLGVRNPGVVEEHFPLGCQATGQVEFHAGGVALARQQLLRRSRVGVGVALVVFLAVEHGHAQQCAAFEQLEPAANFDVAALLRAGVAAARLVLWLRAIARTGTYRPRCCTRCRTTRSTKTVRRAGRSGRRGGARLSLDSCC